MGQPISATGIASNAPPPGVITIAGNSGSTSAFAAGATSDSSRKFASIRGQVAASAATVAVKGSRSTPGSQRRGEATLSVSVAMPMVPAKESWKLTLRASAGVNPSITALVSASDTRIWLSRRNRPEITTSA